MSKVFIALQTNDDTRPIIESILSDNPHAVANESPAMVKIDAEGRMTIRRASIEALIGRDFDLQELHTNLISLSGHIDESDDEFSLYWND
ncbi:MAG: MmoB/DmpM family protein [Gammaproteobacteria bacterium]|jgi:phenol/toluene 2-monooxygenase (NADH) P2/A2|nr:MmoB/DmpM family protein [Gammaproteobacteria bacterium]MBU0772974.1 MmoB/DmpM family protein [Gammaproteobacteria bacterium]MBU0855792.1 MmoB/DmpM family protein [Gammaproteobacteria bacterium]MBU1847703.1 MmoB/DmpM family protein [Gammaproteobacteria bacterium]